MAFKLITEGMTKDLIMKIQGVQGRKDSKGKRSMNPKGRPT